MKYIVYPRIECGPYNVITGNLIYNSNYKSKEKPNQKMRKSGINIFLSWYYYQISLFYLKCGNTMSSFLNKSHGSDSME